MSLPPAIDLATWQLACRPIDRRISAPADQPIDRGGMVHRPLYVIQAVIFHSRLFGGLDNAHRSVGTTSRATESLGPVINVAQFGAQTADEHSAGSSRSEPT